MSADPKLQDTLSGQVTLLGELISQSIAPALQKNGLTFASFELLSAVRSAGESAPQAEVARRLGVAPPSLTESARIAVKAGLIEQLPLERDARAKNLRLTKKGKAALQEILYAVNQAENEMVKEVDPKDLRLAIFVIKRATRNLARKINGPT